MELNETQKEEIRKVFLAANTDQYFDCAKDHSFYAQLVFDIVERVY